jgi:hypothetical protein
MTIITIWVAVYDHRFGQDIEAYGTEAEAELERQGIAGGNWDNEFNTDVPKPDDPEELADAYFEMMGERGDGHSESFTIEKKEITMPESV